VKRIVPHALAVAAVAVFLAGCSGDLSNQIITDGELRSKVMGVIAEKAPLANEMMDRMLASDSTRAIVIANVIKSGPTMQALMGSIARDQTMVDGILNVAVQDSNMRSHVMGVLQGIKMVSK
jgi:hypothetical protein